MFLFACIDTTAYVYMLYPEYNFRAFYVHVLFDRDRGSSELRNSSTLRGAEGYTYCLFHLLSVRWSWSIMICLYVLEYLLNNNARVVPHVRLAMNLFA